MRYKTRKLTAAIVVAAAVWAGGACRLASDSASKNASTPAANSTPEPTRGCPAGTKPCGDACIPKKQSCGGN